MADNSTIALKPGAVYQVLDNGTVSAVDPSTGSMDIIGILPKSSMISSVGSSKVRFNGNHYKQVEIEDDPREIRHKLLEIHSAFSLAFRIQFEEQPVGL